MRTNSSASLPTEFLSAIQTLIPEERCFTDPILRLAYGTDASFYRLIPKMVISVESEAEVIAILKAAQQYQVPITFRAAGTSLSGQACSDSVLLVLGNNWNNKEIRQNGDKIRLLPGVIGAQANRWLLPYGRKIGPDPASIDTCKIGGIVANNASGMCCGTAQNSYSTIADIRVILADGTLLDTEDAASIASFRQTHSELLNGLARLAQETQANHELAAKIRHKYRLKNTVGLSINALVDYDDPIDILKHLMVGSEGILGFISAVTYHTVPEYSFKASAFIVFTDIETCCQAIPILKQQPVSAAELLDRRSLHAVEHKPGLPEWVKTLSKNACALLIESRASSQIQLDQQLKSIMDAIAHLPTEQKIEFTQNPVEYGQLWAIRKETFPAVGGVRQVGTTVIIEDVTFPIERLAEGANRLIELFNRHHYDEAILFGHALDGNLHFVFTQDFSDVAQVARYEAFMADVTQLVAIEFNGSLKAEHGTGRNMAPFVALEWGDEAWQLMWRIKTLFDAKQILNPDVVLSKNKKLHLQNLKPLPKADPVIDYCMECGFCEPVCPSKNLTLTPRQRIVVWRDICAKQRENQDVAELIKQYHYIGIETCAASSLCTVRCPLDIDTGKFVKKYRATMATHVKTAEWVKSNFGTTLKGVRFILRCASIGEQILGVPLMRKVTAGIRKISADHIPRWSVAMPKAAHPIKYQHNEQKMDAPRVIYFTTCVSRMMGPTQYDQEQSALVDKTKQLLEKAGYQVVFPEQINELCCGQAFHSKGYLEQAEDKFKELVQYLSTASRNGQDPIYMDTSSCSLYVLEALKKQDLNLTVYDSVEFIHKFLLDRLQIHPLDENIALHVTCSSRKMSQQELFIDVVKKCTNKAVVIPDEIYCCGFAGDKGFNTPELNRAALSPLKEAVKMCQQGVTNSRTCEIGLNEYSGIPYHHLVYLLDSVTTAKHLERCKKA